MPRLLIIEDERKVLRSLERGLQAEGYEVRTVATGEAGYEQAMTQPFDGVVLDLMLPGRDGLQVLAGIRTAGKTTQVLILTARDTVEDRVIGLDSGADDYLVKPFAFAELLARLRVLLRRGIRERETVLHPRISRWIFCCTASAAPARKSRSRCASSSCCITCSSTRTP